MRVGGPGATDQNGSCELRPPTRLAGLIVPKPSISSVTSSSPSSVSFGSIGAGQELHETGQPVFMKPELVAQENQHMLEALAAQKWFGPSSKASEALLLALTTFRPVRTPIMLIKTGIARCADSHEQCKGEVHDGHR